MVVGQRGKGVLGIGERRQHDGTDQQHDKQEVRDHGGAVQVGRLVVKEGVIVVVIVVGTEGVVMVYSTTLQIVFVVGDIL